MSLIRRNRRIVERRFVPVVGPQGPAGTPGTGSGTTTVPGGLDTQVQFNDGGVFGGDANFVWDKIQETLTIGNNVLNTNSAVSGQTTIKSGNVTGNDNGTQTALAGGTGSGTGNGGIAQIVSGVGGGTGSTNSGEIYIYSGSGPSTASGRDGDVHINNLGGDISTSANGGFLIIPMMSGTPSGVPTGSASVVYDRTNNNLYIYSGGWHQINTTSGTVGIQSINLLTGTTQIFGTTNIGSSFTISSSGTVHTFNFPLTPTFGTVNITNGIAAGTATFGTVTVTNALTAGTATITNTVTAGSVYVTHSAVSHLTFNSQNASTSYVLTIADDGAFVNVGTAGAYRITIPANASVGFPVGTRIGIYQSGVGTVIVGTAAGVTLNSQGTAYVTGGQYAMAQIFQTASNQWNLEGNVQS